MYILEAMSLTSQSMPASSPPTSSANNALHGYNDQERLANDSNPNT